MNIPDQVPDLIFEFVSPSKADRVRDYVEKRADYQRAGVREYVIVDRFEKKVTVLTLVDGIYQERVLSVGDTYETLLLDCMIGDATLFTRTDEVEAAWAVIDPLLSFWEGGHGAPIATYPAGSSGPREADELIAREGFRWRPL